MQARLGGCFVSSTDHSILVHKETEIPANPRIEPCLLDIGGWGSEQGKKGPVRTIEEGGSNSRQRTAEEGRISALQPTELVELITYSAAKMADSVNCDLDS